jgi:putative transposase
VTNRPFRRAYDHRIRAAVCSTGDPQLFAQLGIPRSTASSWIRRGAPRVVTLKPDAEHIHAQLQAENTKLRRRAAVLAVVVRLLLTLIRTAGVRLDWQRVPDAAGKARVMRAVDAARGVIPVRRALSLLGLSASRLSAWRHREQPCELDDRRSCPRVNPRRLTPSEVATSQQMVTAEEYRHIPIGSLALLAQRLGKVYASASTWIRLVKQRGWRRPRRRKYPPKPKVGIRAERPNQIWHIDVCVIRLLDGTRTYLHGIIDNFSRRILAWKLAGKLSPLTTCELVSEAARSLTSEEGTPELYADSGVENVNAEVDALVKQGLIHRVLAQVEVAFSNSKIEAWWRSLRHNWLYLHDLDSVAAVRRLVAFYVEQSNGVVPHSAFHGETPDEMYFSTGQTVAATLAEQRARARQQRLHANRALSCDNCDLVPGGRVLGSGDGPRLA